MFSKITSHFQTQYYQSLIYTLSSYRTEGLKTNGAFTPNLDKIFIEPFVVPKNPEQVSGAMIRQREAQEKLTIWDFLAAAPLESTYRRILLLGPLGSGKTKLLEHITLTYAQNNQRQQNPKAPKLIPVLLSLSQVSQILQRQHTKLVGVIAKIIKQRKGVELNVPIQWLEEKLTQGKCLIIFDGLDDLRTERERTLIIKWLDSQMSAYGDSLFIVASRPHAYRHNQIRGLRVCLELQPFDTKQAEQFFEHWYLESEILRQAHKQEQSTTEKAKGKAKELIFRLKKSSSLATLTSNPLLLTVIINFEENNPQLSKNLGQLYQQICDLLLEERDKEKAVPGNSFLKKREKQYLLQILALELMVRQTREFVVEAGAYILQKSLAPIIPDKLNPEAFFQYIENMTGLLVQTKPRVYQFANPGLQHYLAATQVKISGQEQLLIENIHNSWWAETILLYAGQADCTLLVLVAWKQRNVFSLTLAYDCLKQGKNAELDLRQKLEKWLDDALESKNSQVASFAARVKLLRRLK